MSRACCYLTSVLGPVSAEGRNAVLLIYRALHRRREAIALLELLLRLGTRAETPDFGPVRVELALHGLDERVVPGW